jgi:hypothetical protein
VRAPKLPCDWIAAAGEIPALAESIVRHSVIDDASYLAARAQMDPGVVSSLDSLRFRFACGGDPGDAGDPNAVLEHFRGAPPEVLEVPVMRLRFSVRTKSCLRAAGLTTIGDTVNLGTDKLLAVSGAGLKVLAELYLGFRRTVERFLITRIAVARPRRLAVELRRWLGTLEERTRRILVARLGLDGDTKTLEVLGAELHRTRERVRQIESKAIRLEIESESWPHSLVERLDRLLDGATEPLFLTTLPFYDEFFDDFEYGERSLARAIEAFAPDRIRCLAVNGAFLLSRLTEAEFEDLRVAALRVARDTVARRGSAIDYVVAIESLCMSRGAKELASLMMEFCRPYVQMARPPGSAESLLVAFGRGVDHVVKAIVEEAEEPLHYSEIHRRAVERVGPDVEVRRVHAALDKEGGFYLFGRGTYGLWRHVGLSDAIAARVIDAAEEIVGRADRQWHASEIAAILREEFADLVGDLDFYRLNAVLSRSQNLRYLGRMVWVAATSDDRDSSDRIDIAQACTRFLREAGHPLSRLEILERLNDWRGIGRHFQIHFDGDVFPLEPGVFGLKSRDLPISLEQMGRMLDCVSSDLAERGRGLHASELGPVFARCGLEFANRVTPTSFHAFAARDSRLQVDAADYIGLAEWESTRRVSLTAAGRELAAQGLSPVSAEEFMGRMAALVGRPLSRMDATMSLRDNGYTYDQRSKVWVLPPDENEDASGDMGNGITA